MKGFKNSPNVKKFLLDMFPVVLGILLAFMINNWNESIKEKKALAMAKTQIVQELVSNHKECIRIIDVQQKRNNFFVVYLDSLEKYSNKGYSLAQLPFQGVNIPTISRTAWDATNFSGIISKFDFEELQVLTAVYQVQNIFADLQNQLISIIYGNDMYSPESLSSTFHSLKRLNDDFIDFTRGIANSYEVYLNKYAPESLSMKDEETSEDE
jgi:hypothetical protein